MLRALLLSLALGVATVGTVMATPSQAEARPWHGNGYSGYYGAPGYWYGGSHWRGASHYYYPGYPSYYGPGYAYYSPGYSTYYYSVPAYGYSYSYPWHNYYRR